jgi:hypothetical protein
VAPVRGRTLFFLVALAAGCSLDFSVRPQSVDAGSPADSGGDADAEERDADSGADDQLVPDAATDQAVDGTVDCKTLRDELIVKRKAAQSCQTTTAYCQTSVKDECGCEIFVGMAGSVATNEWLAAIAEFKSANCVNGALCQTCPATDVKQCLFYAGVPLCYPQSQ